MIQPVHLHSHRTTSITFTPRAQGREIVGKREVVVKCFAPTLGGGKMKYEGGDGDADAAAVSSAPAISV